MSIWACLLRAFCYPSGTPATASHSRQFLRGPGVDGPALRTTKPNMLGVVACTIDMSAQGSVKCFREHSRQNLCQIVQEVSRGRGEVPHESDFGVIQVTAA
jgi:hypothetical protein